MIIYCYKNIELSLCHVSQNKYRQIKALIYHHLLNLLMKMFIIINKKIIKATNNKVHKHLEHYANKTAQLPEELKKYAKYVDKIFTYEGKRIVEQRMAIDNNFKPTKWMAKNVWCRGIIDIGVVGSD